MRKAKVTKQVTLKGKPVFLYTSKCCNVLAEKPPTVKVDKKTAETQGLGKFRCPSCRKRCIVGRTKNIQE